MKLIVDIFNRFVLRRSKEQLVDPNINPNINLGASDIKRALFGYEYIIKLDPGKIYEFNGWDFSVNGSFAKDFMSATADVADQASLICMRGVPSTDDIFISNEFGCDAVFAGTNNAHHATLIALRYK